MLSIKVQQLNFLSKPEIFVEGGRKNKKKSKIPSFHYSGENKLQLLL